MITENNIKPICSLCDRTLDTNKKQRSVMMIGVSQINEYILCKDCYSELDSKLVDHTENIMFKRMHRPNGLS